MGGPICKNKAFFFFNFSGFRQRSSSTVQLTFPSASMQQGNFGAPCSAYRRNRDLLERNVVVQSLDGAAFAGNQIPQGMITTQPQDAIAHPAEPDHCQLARAAQRSPNYVGLVFGAQGS